MVRQWQELFNDRRYSFTNIDSPDFVALSRAYHINAENISERKNLEEGIRKMLETEGPYLLEVKVGKENNVFPMVPQGCSVSEIRLS
jgi:acetolactate synthase-1/2/3 large subunit